MSLINDAQALLEELERRDPERAKVYRERIASNRHDSDLEYIIRTLVDELGLERGSP